MHTYTEIFRVFNHAILQKNIAKKDYIDNITQNQFKLPDKSLY